MCCSLWRLYFCADNNIRHKLNIVLFFSGGGCEHHFSNISSTIRLLLAAEAKKAVHMWIIVDLSQNLDE